MIGDEKIVCRIILWDRLVPSGDKRTRVRTWVHQQLSRDGWLDIETDTYLPPPICAVGGWATI